jgi:hypothetical protein
MDDLMSSISSSFLSDPQATIIEASTKLALEWADQHRPVSAENISETLQLLISSFQQGLGSSTLDKQAQVAVVKSASRLSAYWYTQNKSVSINELQTVIAQFEKAAITDLK